MINEVRLPEISENVEGGDVIKILVSVGDAVEVDQPLVEIETEKAVLEVPSPHKGKVAEILVRPGDTVKVGQVFMTIDTAAVPAQETAVPKSPAAETKTRAEKAPAASPPAAERKRTEPPLEPPDASAAPPLASPAVRRLARELGVDIRLVAGSGDRGRILEEDLKLFARQAVEGAAPAGPGAETPGRPAGPRNGDPSFGSR
jgi:pyruvate dehydrogenase E2 component (dihydrolipoamide acetyltransferase)